MQLPDDVAFDAGNMGKRRWLIVCLGFGMSGVVRSDVFGIVAAQVFNGDAEEVRDLFEPRFVRRALAALSRRPLLGRDLLADELGKRFGALLAAAPIGEFLRACGADV